MLLIILDTFILMVLMKLIGGNEEEGFGKPAVIAILASVALVAANIGAAGAGASAALWIILGSILGIGVIVALCCILLMSIQPLKSGLIGAAFVVYKIAISFILALAFGAG